MKRPCKSCNWKNNYFQIKQSSALVFCLAFISLLASSCAHHVIIGSGKQTTEDRSVSSFSNIEISATLNATINIVEGAQPSVQLNGYHNILSDIKTEVKDGTLRIYTEESVDFSVPEKTKATIVVPSLSSLSLSGAPDAKLHGNIKSKSFKLDISGAGDVEIDSVNSPELTVDLSGAGDIKIRAGNVQHSELNISGAGSIKAFGLQSNEMVTHVSGAGECEVNAQQKLDTHISGVGKVKYRGHPVISSQTSGVGGVEDAN